MQIQKHDLNVPELANTILSNFINCVISYVFQILKESMTERNEQLTELGNLFRHLQENRALQGYEGEKTSR